MSITKRLLLILAISLLTLVALGGFQIWKQQEAQQRFDYLKSNVFPSIQALDEAKSAMSGIREGAYRHLLASDPAVKENIEQNIGVADARFDAVMEKYGKTLLSGDADRKLYEADVSLMKAYRSVRAKFFELSRADQTEEGSLMAAGSMGRIADNLGKNLSAHIDYNYQLAEQLGQQNRAAYRLAVQLSVAAIALAIAVTAILGARLFSSIGRNLNAIRQTLESVSASLDLTQQAPVERMDEIGKTASAFNQLMARIAAVMAQVRQSSDSVSVASREIAVGNVDLSSRTEEQAASLEQTAASMAQLTSTVKQNADNARQASTLAADASEVAQRGNRVVGQVVETMDDINQSSAKIADITGIIEGIAFQTNILALNAAVEAARAGEQGRGFAVVASEVRSLAQRSAAAAKEIKELIGASVQKIRAGSTLVDDAGQTMSEVSDAVAKVTDIMGEIAAASVQQSRGIEQVHQAITQMDEVTQQNAALVEQATAAAQSLQDQGRQLDQAVSIFKLGADTAAVARRTAPPAHRNAKAVALMERAKGV